MKKCIRCNKEAKYIEWSPDGSDYFCTKECHWHHTKEQHDKGLFWRSLPLRKMREDEQ